MSRARAYLIYCILFSCQDNLTAKPCPTNNSPQIYNTVTNIQVNGFDLPKLLQDVLHQNSQHGYEWLKDHQTACAGVGASAVYLTIAKRVWDGKTMLLASNNWCNWKSDVPLVNLLGVPARSLYQELHYAIINKYANNSQADLLAPLVQFSHDLNLELKTLDSFYQIGLWTSKLKLSWIFWISAKNISDTQEKIARLTYFKTLINDSIRIQQVIN